MSAKQYAHFNNCTPEEHIEDIRDRHRVCMGEPHTTRKGLIYHLVDDALSIGVF